MKYKCADGINRDEAIDRYLALLQKEKELRAQVEKMTREWHETGRQLGRLVFDELGFVGLKAVPDETYARQHVGRG
jgi:hypothetical protein